MSLAKDTIDKQLERMYQNNALGSEIITELTKHAINNSYMGPPVGGDQFAGWPVGALLDLAPANLRPRLHLEMKAMSYPRQRSYGAITGNATQTPAPGSALRQPYTLNHMLAVRMQWAEGERTGFEHIAMHQTKDTVHIWIITKDAKSVVLEDEVGLFPSDALVTKLRLL